MLALPIDDDLRDALQRRIAATAERITDRLRARGRALADAPTLALPPLLLETLAALLTHARHTPDPDGALAAHADVLARTWTEDMPALLVESLVSNEPTCAALFHTALTPRELPRLTAAIDRLATSLAALGAGPPPIEHATGTLAELYPRTHFGQCMPMLYTFPHDRAAHAVELAAGHPLAEVVDTRLTAPLVHELSHLHRDRRPLWPPYLEECVAGWIGARALPTLVWPEPGTDHALFGAHWFAQVGQALAMAVGPDTMLRAHAGLASWPEAMPAGLVDTAERLGWAQQQRLRTVHLLGENTRPMPWVWLCFLAASGELERLRPAGGWTLDALEAVDPVVLGASCSSSPTQGSQVIDCALRTMFNVALQLPDTGAWRVRAEPPDAPIVLDWQRGLARGPRRGRALAEPTWWLPPDLCHAWHRHGVARHVVTFEPTVDRDAACADLARWLVEPSSRRAWQGAGWRAAV